MSNAAGTVAIIGAGMAGLACATRLGQAGLAVELFDKGRGPGGRMSTRRLETPQGLASFDHGAQYFTARGAGFAALVQQWVQQGVAAPWPAAGDGAFVGVPGMNAPIKALAADQSVAWQFRIEALLADEAGCRLIGPAGPTQAFSAVVVALPAEQAAELLAEIEPDLSAKAAGSSTQPCWTVMAAFAERLPIAPDTLRDLGPLGWAARNVSKPGRSGPETWVLQGGPDWSRDHLEASGEAVSAVLLGALAEAMGGPLPEPLAVEAHRWRYARSASGTDGALWSSGARIGCCGDWLIGPRVECAWDSGVALADRILADRQTLGR
jgi:hypothetical protein